MIEEIGPLALTLPTEVIEEDHRLERVGSEANEALYKWRWEHTKGARYPIAAYARAVERNEKAIRRSVVAYQLIRDGSVPADALALASMAVETRACGEAVASAEGISLATAERTRRSRVRRVRDEARQRAEDRQTSVEEEIAGVMEDLRQFEHGTEDRPLGKDHTFVIKQLSRAEEAFAAALKRETDGDFSEESLALIDEVWDKLRRMISLRRSHREGRPIDVKAQLKVIRGVA